MFSPPVTFVCVPRLRTVTGTFTSRVVVHMGVDAHLLKLMIIRVRRWARTLCIPVPLVPYPVGNRSVVPPGSCGNGIPLTALSLKLVRGIKLCLRLMVAFIIVTLVLGLSL